MSRSGGTRSCSSPHQPTHSTGTSQRQARSAAVLSVGHSTSREAGTATTPTERLAGHTSLHADTAVPQCPRRSDARLRWVCCWQRSNPPRERHASTQPSGVPRRLHRDITRRARGPPQLCLAPYDHHGSGRPRPGGSRLSPPQHSPRTTRQLRSSMAADCHPLVASSHRANGPPRHPNAMRRRGSGTLRPWGDTIVAAAALVADKTINPISGSQGATLAVASPSGSMAELRAPPAKRRH